MQQIPFIVLLMLSCLVLHGQTTLEEFVNTVGTFTASQKYEKIFLHTDREFYTADDTLWFKAYLVDGMTHQPGTESDVVYVDIHDSNDSLVRSMKLYIPEGTAAGDFVFDGDLAPGLYFLRAYTEYMRNWDDRFFFVKTFEIWDPLAESSIIPSQKPKKSRGAEASIKAKPPSLGIYPEGGDLVNGLKSRIALELENFQGDPETLVARLMTESGDTVQKIKFYERGLASLEFVPRKSISYQLELEFAGTSYAYRLPEARDAGFVLNIINRGSKLIVNLASKMKTDSPAYILAHIRGLVVWHSEVSFDENGSFVAILPKDALPEGVVHFTVFDGSFRPYCERLVYIANPSIQTEIRMNAENYLVQQEGKIFIQTPGLSNGQEDTVLDCSLSVFHSPGDFTASGSNIRSYLLLNSDLHGKIEDPAYFFEDENNFRKQYLLDLVMMTRGWRRFSWQDVIDKGKILQSDFSPEKGVYVSGWTGGVVNLQKPVKSRLVYTAMDASFYEEEKESDDNGRFGFGPFVSYDTIKCIIQARRLNGDDKDKLDGKRNILIHLDEVNRPDFSNSTYHLIDRMSRVEASEEYREEERKALYTASQYRDMMQVEMDELVVKGKRKTLDDSLNTIARKLSIYSEPSDRVVPDDTDIQGMQSVFDLIRRVPGVRIDGSPPNQSVTIRGVASLNASLTPLYLVDGMITDEERINSISPYEVKFIDILKDGRAAIFGSRGANGVIAIYTGRELSGNPEGSPGIINFTLDGFYKAREFSSPIKSYAFRDGGLPDNRKTLLWNPELILDGGEKTVSFICSDRKGSYRIILNGISRSGNTIFSESRFRVE